MIRINMMGLLEQGVHLVGLPFGVPLQRNCYSLHFGQGRINQLRNSEPISVQLFVDQFRPVLHSKG